MYTQCPDCHTAFRVTADVLKQAAGKVRCGGCGNGFNALEFLSESMPEPGRRAQTGKESLELKPESQAADDLPGSASADQSATLLKTLDKLSGSDVRIEDTGIEWRVLAEDEVGTAADDDIAVDVEVEDQPGLSEIFEASPTPVDQFLKSSPPKVDSPEIFAEEANRPARTPVDELRFDDNTPLPEGFGYGDEPTVVPVGASLPEENAPRRKAAHEPQVDLELTQPADWEDILGEFENIAGELSEPSIAGETAMLEGVSADSAAEPDPHYMDNDLEALLKEASAEVRQLDGLLGDSRVDEIDAPGDVAAEPDQESVADAAAEVVDEANESGQLELIESDDDVDQASTVDVSAEDTEKLASTDTHALDEDVYGMGEAEEPGDNVAEEPAKEAPEESTEAAAGIVQEDEGTMFETIIMEGEKISAGFDDDKFVADQKAAAASLASAAKAEAKRKARKSAARARRRRNGLAAGIGVLALLLVGQYLHQTRNSLATIPAFNNVAGPVYRALGKPLYPEWDVTGWRFETTRHDADGTDSNLAISSRVGNVSATALPYPIIAVSLSDRFEEPLGSVTLDPSEYLADNLDPRNLIDPGNTFEAAILVRNVPEKTASFRLRVCYRAAGGQLRCKEDGFL